MDKLTAIKTYLKHFQLHMSDQERGYFDWLIQEIETLRLDNTYLQQRLKREVEK